MGISAAASLITFPTCFFGGQAITSALITMSTKVTENVAKAVATTVGGLVGGGVHSGAYVLQCEVDGRPIEPLGLVLSGVGGIFEGSSAGYLGAKLVATKFNRYKGIKTLKFSQDNTNVEVFKVDDEFEEALGRIDAGTEFFPERKLGANFPPTESQQEWLKTTLKRRPSVSTVSTGGTVKVGRESIWSVDDAVERAVGDLAEELAADSKWVRISKYDTKAQNVLFRNEGKELLFLEHAGPQRYGAFPADRADAFAHMVRKIKIPGDQTPSTVTLIGCDVPQQFAWDLQTNLTRLFNKTVKVHTLPFAEEGTLLSRNPVLKTWNYYKKVVDPKQFQEKFLDNDFWDLTVRRPIDIDKPYLSPEMSLIDSDFEKLFENTNFYMKMNHTFTAKELPNLTIPVSLIDF